MEQRGCTRSTVGSDRRGQGRAGGLPGPGRHRAAAGRSFVLVDGGGAHRAVYVIAMSAVMHDVSHSVAGEDWRRQAAEADKSGKMMAELVKQTEMQQALFEVRHRQELSLQRALQRIAPREAERPLRRRSDAYASVAAGCHIHL